MSAQQEMNPLALLGGVFDPLHQGHVAVAEAALELPGVEEVRWIPCKEPPHEKDSTHAPAEVRLAMAQLFCQEVEQFTCDDIEFERDGPSWTIDTVRALAEQYPGRPLLWLIGSDNVRSHRSMERSRGTVEPGDPGGGAPPRLRNRLAQGTPPFPRRRKMATGKLLVASGGISGHLLDPIEKPVGSRERCRRLDTPGGTGSTGVGRMVSAACSLMDYFAGATSTRQ